MYNTDYMYAIERSDEYLAHYGIKGMKWGVRKAIEAGGSGRGNRKLARQYAKASRKLARLERRATKGKSYARRAAALGAGAALAGGLATVGTSDVGKFLREAGKTGDVAVQRLGSGLQKSGTALANKYAGKNKHLRVLGNKMRVAGRAVEASPLNQQLRVAGVHAGNAVSRWGKGTHDLATAAQNIGGKYGQADAGKKVADTLNKYGLGKVTNNQLARAGAAAASVGLAGAAGYNAYRAATTKRAAKKAAEFKKAMNESFKGTAYANGGESKSSGSKKSSNNRRRRRHA